MAYWTLVASDPLGNVTSFNLGNGLTTTRSYDRAAGFMLSNSTHGSSTTITDEEYQWDLRGNLTQRTDGAALNGTPDLREEFLYDAYDRLLTTMVTSPSVPGSPKTYSNEYYDSGRIKSKGSGQGSDYSNYVYGFGNSSNYSWDAGPHAVQAVTIGSGTRTFRYDSNGNVVSDSTGRTFIWSAFNKPLQAANATYQSAWAYGPDRNYYLQTNQTYVGAVGCNDPFWYTTRTYYAGDSFERVENWANQGNVEYRMYIRVGNARIALHTEWSTGATPREEYLHHDHLGSLVAVTASNQSLVDRLSYDPWGKRRGAGFGGAGNAWLSMSAGINFIPTSLSHTRRGFTDHEQVDQLNFIHMNGRIYDPEIGRFLSADPMVQFPESTQGLDRYAYVNNNPLSYTDPTGHGIWSAIATVLSFVTGPIAAVALIAVGGYLDSGSLQGALFAVAGAVAGIGVAGLDLPNLATALANGLVQGALGAAQGQKFGAAFLSAAVSSGFGPRAGTKSDLFGDPVGRVIQSAVVGGTASVIGGGKFANGAATGAFVAAGKEWNARLLETGPAAGQLRTTRASGLDADVSKKLFDQEYARLVDEGVFKPMNWREKLFGVDDIKYEHMWGGKSDTGVVKGFDTLLQMEQEPGGWSGAGGYRSDFTNDITIYRQATLFSRPDGLNSSRELTPRETMRWTILHERGHQVFRGGTEAQADKFARGYF